jgi:hypothetical protein
MSANMIREEEKERLYKKRSGNCALRVIDLIARNTGSDSFCLRLPGDFYKV